MMGELLGFLKTLRILGNLKLVYNLLDFSIHEDREIMGGPVNPVVGDPALRIIVGTDLGTAVSGGNHSLPLGRKVIQILLVLHIIESCTKLVHSLFQILQLISFILALDYDSGWDVSQPYR